MVTPTTFELHFVSEPKLEFIAGQFLSVVIPGAGPKGRNLRRAYSIASSPDYDHLEICVKIVEGGPGTTYLKGLREGDDLQIFAPYGDFVYKTTSDRRAFFIATGTGISPYNSIFQTKSFQENTPKSLHCLFGVRTEDEILYDSAMTNVKGLEWIKCVSRPKGEWNGFKGRVTDYLRELPEETPWKETDFYLCGNGAMISEVKEILLSKEVDKKNIHQEIYYK